MLVSYDSIHVRDQPAILTNHLASSITCRCPVERNSMSSRHLLDDTLTRIIIHYRTHSSHLLPIGYTRNHPITASTLNDTLMPMSIVFRNHSIPLVISYTSSHSLPIGHPRKQSSDEPKTPFRCTIDFPIDLPLHFIRGLHQRHSVSSH